MEMILVPNVSTSIQISAGSAHVANGLFLLERVDSDFVHFTGFLRTSFGNIICFRLHVKGSEKSL
jgi:hypothetical protein